MSASAFNLQSTKRPLEDPSSPSGPNDQPEAKRPALDKVVKSEEDTTVTTGDKHGSNGEDVHGATHPIHSPVSHVGRTSSESEPRQSPQDESNWIHIRAVISSQEAATIIGKGGENVSEIRRSSGTKCTVSDYSRGAVERILTVSGPQDAVAKVSYMNCCAKAHMWIFGLL